MTFAALPVPTPEVVWWGLIPVIVLSGSALLMLTAASLPWRIPAWLASTWTVAAGIAVVVAVFPMWARIQDDGPLAFLGSAVAVDGSTLFVTATLAVAVVATALLGRAYLEREDLPGVEFYVLLLLSAAEVLSIAVYVLAAMHLRRVESQEAAIKYFVLGAFSSAFLLYGIALVYGATGSTSLVRINAHLASTVLVQDAMLLTGFALVLVGFGFKVAAVPFHAWTPDVYQGAPTPVVAWMAAGVKAAAFTALLRTFVLSFGAYSADWRPAVAVMAGVTVVGGATVAVVQTDVKRMLAYSSIVHGGFILTGVQAADDRGTSAILVYLGVYTLLAVGSFGVLSAVGGVGDTGHRLDDYRGLARRQPLLAAAFTVLLLGQAGIPFTGGFVAKLGVIAAAVDVGSYAVAAVAMLGAAIAAFVYLRLLVAMYLDDDQAADTHPVAVPVGARMVIGLAAAGVLFVGLVPGPLVDLSRDAIPVLVGG